MKARGVIVWFIALLIVPLAACDSPTVPEAEPRVSMSLHPAQQCVSRLALQNGNTEYNLGMIEVKNLSTEAVVFERMRLSIVEMPGNAWVQFEASDFSLTLVEENGVMNASETVDWDTFFELRRVIAPGETLIFEIEGAIPQYMIAGELLLGLAEGENPPVQVTTAGGGSVTVSLENATGGGAAIGSSCPKGVSAPSSS